MLQSIWIYRLVRWVLSALFIWAGTLKLADPSSFGVVIRDFGIVPEWSVTAIAIALPVLEILAAVGLIFNIRGSLSFMAGLLVIFILIVGYAALLGLDIDCGCFGSEEPEFRAYSSLHAAFYRDLAMLAGVFFLYWWRYRNSMHVQHSGTGIKTRFINKHQPKERIMDNGKLIFFILAATLLVFGSTTSASAFGFGDDKFKKEVEKEQGAVKLAREVQRGGYDIVTTEELKKMLDSGKDMLVVDTMPYEKSYKKQHIPGAKQFLFPIPEMTNWDNNETDGKTEDDFTKLLGTDKDKTIVIYCGFVKCTRSHNGAMWAKKLGYSNVLRHPGGIYAWIGAEYPTENVK